MNGTHKSIIKEIDNIIESYNGEKLKERYEIAKKEIDSFIKNYEKNKNK